jgi:hypothetical protein
LTGILDSIPRAKDFTLYLGPDEAVDLTLLNHNRLVAYHRFSQVLIARLFTMVMFLEEARKLSPSGPLDHYRGHWLVLQLQRDDVLPKDTLYTVVNALKEASNEYLGWGDDFGKARELLDEISAYLPGISLALVVDEAQNIARMYREAFGDNSSSMTRSVLHELDGVLSRKGYVIYSGTGLIEKDVLDNTSSNVARVGMTTTQSYSQTKAFDSRDAQSMYILRYLPLYLRDSPSSRLLLGRAWDWLCGRYFLVLPYTTLANISSKASFHCIFC